MPTTFAGVRFELSEQWYDITEDLDPGSPPTLARENGVGVIQFSVAKYKSGERPSITEITLKDMLSNLLNSNQLAVEPATLQGSYCFGVSATSAHTDEVIGAWYLSNGTDIALVTYTCTCGDPAYQAELAEAERLAKTLEFA